MDLLDTQVQFEFLPFLRVYKSGRYERFLTSTTDTVPASIDPTTGVSSRDVVVVPETGVSARLYLPNLSGNPCGKLPLLIYFHGGGFFFESAHSPTYHNYLNCIVAKANIMAVSVDYRLAPEHPLPAAYDDSWQALQWVAAHASQALLTQEFLDCPEDWLASHVDFTRVFLAGDSAGANIAHNMAMRAGETGLGHGVKIEGLVLIHPYFWGNERMESEKAEDCQRMLQPAVVDAQWPTLCPGTQGNDDPRVNPLADGAPSLAGLGCRRVLVSVAERDLLRERGQTYYEGLRRSGWSGEVELLVTEEEDHVFHLFNPGSKKAVAKMERLLNFLQKE